MEHTTVLESRDGNSESAVVARRFSSIPNYHQSIPFLRLLQMVDLGIFEVFFLFATIASQNLSRDSKRRRE